MAERGNRSLSGDHFEEKEKMVVAQTEAITVCAFNFID